jgi:hypothetical protein
MRRTGVTPDRNPLYGKPSKGSQILHWLPPIPTAPLKAVRRLIHGGATINDVVATAIGRAVWRYMDRITPMNRRVPDNEWLVSYAAPVSVWSELPQKVAFKSGGCRYRALNPRQHQHAKTTPDTQHDDNSSVLAHFLVMKNHFRELKRLRASHSAQVGYMLVGNILPEWLALKFLKPMTFPTYMVTNLPRIPMTFKFWGMPLTKMVIVPSFVAEQAGTQS